MTLKPQTIELTPLQISHAITAVRAHMKALLKKNEEDPDGTEMNDYFIIQSVIQALEKAEEAADPSATLG